MNFNDLLSVAAKNQKQAEKQLTIKRYSTVVPPPKKESKKVNTGAIKAYLNKKEDLQQKVVCSSKQKEELLKARKSISENKRSEESKKRTKVDHVKTIPHNGKTNITKQKCAISNGRTTTVNQKFEKEKTKNKNAIKGKTETRNHEKTSNVKPSERKSKKEQFVNDTKKQGMKSKTKSTPINFNDLMKIAAKKHKEPCVPGQITNLEETRTNNQKVETNSNYEPSKIDKHRLKGAKQGNANKYGHLQKDSTRNSELIQRKDSTRNSGLMQRKESGKNNDVAKDRKGALQKLHKGKAGVAIHRNDISRPAATPKQSSKVASKNLQSNEKVSLRQTKGQPHSGHPMTSSRMSSGHPMANGRLSSGQSTTNGRLSSGHPMANGRLSSGHPMANGRLSSREVPSVHQPMKRKGAAYDPHPIYNGNFKRPSARPPPIKSRKYRLDSDEDSEYEDDDFIDDGPLEDEQVDVSSYIKEIFGYDKSRYGYESDYALRNMEASFSQISKEEARSTRLGMMEDLEDMRKEKEEMKRQAEKQAKRRKH